VHARLALLFDFDGTLYVGDLPVLAYARHCAEQLPALGGTQLIDGIRFFLEGKSVGGGHVDLGDAEDGYQAVEILAAAAGLTENEINTAYRLSRDDLAASAFAIDAPEGLDRLLTDLREIHVIVVAGHPVGVAEVLAATGVTGHIDQIITDAAKPEGMPAIIDAALSTIDAGTDPRRLLVVGDRWSSDLADACRAGATTALIDRFGRGDGDPTVRAADLASLIPAIRAWADQFGGLITGEPDDPARAIRPGIAADTGSSSRGGTATGHRPPL